jgi:hypothetical protein
VRPLGARRNESGAVKADRRALRNMPAHAAFFEGLPPKAMVLRRTPAAVDIFRKSRNGFSYKEKTDAGQQNINYKGTTRRVEEFA